MKRNFSILFALAFVLGCLENGQESAERPLDGSNPESSVASASDQEAQSVGHAPFEVTVENIYDHEEYWPNIVEVAADWEPEAGAPKRPQVLQGVLVRIELDGTLRMDLARYGRADLPITQTDVVERANAVYRGETFKHRGNFALQIGNMLVSSAASVPGPQASRPIKMASVLLCVFADPRAEDFGALASRLAEFGEATHIVPIFIPQNVERNDLEFVHATLREHSWRAPFVYPERAAVRTNVLLRDPPEEPRLLLLTREGRVLFEGPYDEEFALDRVEEIAASFPDDTGLQSTRHVRDEAPVRVEG